jgi:hypothetical protein
VIYLINEKAFNNDNKVIISLFEVWSHYSTNIPFSLLLLLLFPIYVIIITFKKGFSNVDFLVFGNLIISLLYYIIFAESGDRKFDGNFAWGLMIASFIAFAFSLIKLFILKKSNKLLFSIGLFFYVLHVLSGIFYFIKIYNGGHYM